MQHPFHQTGMEKGGKFLPVDSLRLTGRQILLPYQSRKLIIRVGGSRRIICELQCPVKDGTLLGRGEPGIRSARLCLPLFQQQLISAAFLR